LIFDVRFFLWFSSVMKMSLVFLVFMLKNRPEPNKTGSVWTGSRFGLGYINKKYYFPVRLNFWVKTRPNQTVNTHSFQGYWSLFTILISDYEINRWQISFYSSQLHNKKTKIRLKTKKIKLVSREFLYFHSGFFIIIMSVQK
jgi:hypothetical protein